MERDEAKLGIVVVICATIFMTIMMVFPEIPPPEKFLKIELVRKDAGAETIYFIRKRAQP